MDLQLQLERDMLVALQPEQGQVEMEELRSGNQEAPIRSLSPVPAEDEDNQDLDVPSPRKGWYYVLKENPGPGFCETAIEMDITSGQRTRSGRV